MQDSTVSFSPLTAASKNVARQLLILGENRIYLLTVEIQQERERLVLVLLFGFAIATCCLLAGIALSAAVVTLLWAFHPVAALLGLAAIYGIAGILFYRRMASLLNDWRTLSASLEQFRKDTQCLANLIA